MTITINPIMVDVPLDVKEADVHHNTLHAELAAALGEAFTGITTSADRAHAHIRLDASPETVAQIVAALDGYEKKLGGTYNIEIILNDIYIKYGEKIVSIIASGKAPDHLNATAALKRGAEIAPAAHLLVLDDATYGPLQQAYAEFTQRVSNWDIRLRILAELQEKLGPEIENLAFIHGNAFVTMTGTVPPDIAAKIDAVVKAHDKTKAPPPEPTESEKQDERLAKMEAQIAALLKAGKKSS